MTVAVPVLTDVTKPEEEIVATLVGFMLQETDGLFVVLPSLFVPNTVICTVLLVVPVSMVGDAGPIEIEDSVGFWKKPVQLMVSANATSMAKVQARRSFWMVDNIVVQTPWARFARVDTLRWNCFEALGSISPCGIRRNEDVASYLTLRYDFCLPAVVKNCSRRKFGLGVEVHFRAARNQRG